MEQKKKHVLAFRLIKERFLDTPLSSEGVRRWGGRWNPPGIGILYTSSEPSLTVLEQLVHLPTLPYEDLPRLWLLTIRLPQPPRLLLADQLPPDWNQEYDFSANYACLSPWLEQPDVLAIGVPSAVIRQSVNYLIHPLHPAFSSVEVIGAERFQIDRRLWKP